MLNGKINFNYFISIECENEAYDKEIEEENG
jgi:hypothetical protein